MGARVVCGKQFAIALAEDGDGLARKGIGPALAQGNEVYRSEVDFILSAGMIKASDG